MTSRGNKRDVLRLCLKEPIDGEYSLEYPLELYRMSENECQGFRKLSSDRQTDIQTDTTEVYTMPIRGWSVICNTVETV